MDDAVVLDAENLSKVLGVPVGTVTKRLEELKNCQFLALIQDGKLVVILPESNSAAVKESNDLYERFVASAGRKG